MDITGLTRDAKTEFFGEFCKETVEKGAFADTRGTREDERMEEGRHVWMQMWTRSCGDILKTPLAKRS